MKTKNWKRNHTPLSEVKALSSGLTIRMTTTPYRQNARGDLLSMDQYEKQINKFSRDHRKDRRAQAKVHNYHNHFNATT